MKSRLKAIVLYCIGVLIFTLNLSADTRILEFGKNLEFGNVNVGEDKTRILTLYNKGDSLLHIETIRFHKRLKGAFRGNFTGDIPANGEREVLITFSPAEEIDYTGLVYVESDRTNGGDRSKLLTGKGISSVDGNITVDTRKPIIRVIGTDEIVNVGKSYTDKGATATDDYDGDITDKIVINNPVDTEESKIYLVTYNVEDSSGNKAKEGNRTVIVVPSYTQKVLTDFYEHFLDREPEFAGFVYWADRLSIKNSMSCEEIAYGFINGDEYDEIRANISDEEYIEILYGALFNRDAEPQEKVDWLQKLQDGMTRKKAFKGFLDSEEFKAQGTKCQNRKVDFIRPVITLKGENPQQLRVGEPYIELGATAIDDVDGDISSKINISSNVETSKVGTYIVTYSVLDKAGNSATMVSRTVEVKAKDISLLPNGLLINELSSGIYKNSPRWFELYNSTNREIELSEYRLKSLYYDGTTSGTFIFSLPERTIPAKGYLVLRPNYGPAFNSVLRDIENDKVIYLKDTTSKKYPIWYSTDGGYLELLKDNQTVDFLAFGTGDWKPQSTGAWRSENAPIFGSDNWESLARKYNQDSNTSSDWIARNFQTYASINDVTCNEDLDEDGIPDCSELSGTTYAGLDIYSYGARVNQKDIFIEVDYMDSTDGGRVPEDIGVIPTKKSLEMVRDAFAKNGYAIHFDVGDLFSKNGLDIDVENMDLGGGNQVPYSKFIGFGSTKNGGNIHTYKAMHMDAERKQIFYYMLFGTTQNSDGSGGSSGVAEVLGNDSIITLGHWGFRSDNIEDRNILINYQAGTMMHEFGHNLGLRHGGNENKNYKPNYLSVMNYMYQLNGLPTIGNNEGDRYFHGLKGCKFQNNSLVNSYWGSPNKFIIDYSHGEGRVLDEVNGIEEETGLGQVSSSAVDYNCNDSLTDTLFNFDLNRDEKLDSLSDNDDWSRINIIFSHTSSGNLGQQASLLKRDSSIVNPILDDIQPIADEKPIEISTMLPYQ